MPKAVGDEGKKELAKHCPACEAGYPAEMRFCPQDGTPLAEVSDSKNGLPAENVPENGKIESTKQKNGKSENRKPAGVLSFEPGENERHLDAEPSLDEDVHSDFSDHCEPPGSSTRTVELSGNPASVRATASLIDPRLELLGQLVESRYEVTENIGKGGMSMVFKARDRRLKKFVALKVLMPHLSVDPLSVQRFQQEATAASHLDHPSIVKVYNVGTTDSGLPFMTMDFLQGRSLSAVIKEKGRLEYTEALNIFVQLAAALTHAHEKGVIHRDLKPSNVILSHQGDEAEVAKLVDFGIAKVLVQDGHTQAKLTQTGDVFGSPHYMSPEQCLGGELDERSDVYSMGCLMYEALTGRPPHTGDSTLQILHKHISETPPSFKSVIPETDATARLEAIVFKCLAPKRDDRLQSMRLLKNELTELYMARGKNPVDQTLAKLSLAWAKRPKLSTREKVMASAALVVSFMVLYAIWFCYSFITITTNSPWLSSNILNWIPPKPPGITNEDKASLAFTQVEMYIKKADEFIAEGVSTPGQIVKALTNAGLGLEENGRLEDASRSLERASDIAARYISKFSTAYANLLFYRGRVCYEMGKFDEAETHLKAALESDEWPASPQWKGDCESMLADSYNFMGNRSEAEDYYQRALDRWKNSGSDSVRFSITAARFGDLIVPYNTQKSFKYAYTLYKSAKNNWRRNGELESQNVALCDLRISQVMAGVGEKEQSLYYLKEANDAMARAVGSDNPKRASVMMKYADALWNKGDHMEALSERYRCWQILNHAPPPVATRSI